MEQANLRQRGSGFEGDRHYVERNLEVRNCTSSVHIPVMLVNYVCGFCSLTCTDTAFVLVWYIE